jgi:DNA modification methylase
MSVKTSLYSDWIMPPFSVHDANRGPWKVRKEYWLSLGIKSELGRDLKSGGIDTSHGAYMPPMTAESIFDPVLTECYYFWHSPPNGLILDPFAGGSVRGIVAQQMGRQYYGIDLNHKQVDANYDQLKSIVGEPVYQCKNPPVWIHGDSRTDIPEMDVDYIFTCPPYGSLEQYSDDRRDLSNMPYYDFLDAFNEIIEIACSCLKENRFATIVVGDFRRKNGLYHNFVADTIHAFQRAGMGYYNEAILVTPLGTLPFRARRFFEASRKIGKTHQNVLTFLKGNDPEKAAREVNCLPSVRQSTL